MFARNSRTIYLECDFSKGHVPFLFFGIDWFQIAAIVKWLLLAEPEGGPSVKKVLAMFRRLICLLLI
jgi:hypothetical protein